MRKSIHNFVHLVFFFNWYLNMANRYGLVYDPNFQPKNRHRDDNYIPQAHRNPKTPVHALVYEQNRERALATKRKAEKKASGCGHKSLFAFVTVDNSRHQPPPWNQASVPFEVDCDATQPSQTQLTQDGFFETFDDAFGENFEGKETSEAKDSESVDSRSPVRRLNFASQNLSLAQSVGSRTQSSSDSSEVKVLEVRKADSSVKQKDDKKIEARNEGKEEVDHAEDEVKVESDVKVEDEVKVEGEGKANKGEDESVVEFVCVACGNKKDDCHQYIYGTFLVHECISYFEERAADEVTDELLEYHFRFKYNQYLRFLCHRETKKHDVKTWYDPPECLKKGSLKFALKLVHGQQVYYHIKKNRVEGVAGKSLLNKATTVYTYNLEFN